VMDSNHFKSAFLEHLEQIAFFLEYNEENPFKIRAFKAAADLLSEFSSTELCAKVRDKSLLEVKGIGKGIFSVATSFLETDTSPEWKAAKGDLPISILELLEIKGLGAKKIRHLAEELQIKSLGELEYACAENRLISLKGFGEKTQEKILKEIQIAKFRRGKQLLSDALMAAIHIETELGKKISFRRVGELGRKLEIIEKMEYLIKTPQPQKFLAELKGNSFAENLEVSQGQATLEIEPGNRVIFHFSTAESFYIESIYRTSSDSHWQSLQSVAKKLGLHLTPEKLSNQKGEMKISSEPELYKHLDLPFYPAEAREFEVQAQPIHFCEESDLTGVFHLHTTASDGINSLEEMCEAAQKHDWKYIGLSDHSKTANYARGLDEDALERQWKEVDELQKKLKGRIRILKGVESDILKDGKLDYSSATFKKLDFVIASIHNRYGMTEMTDRLIKAIENPSSTMIGHLTGRLLLARPGYDLDFDKVIDAAIANKKIIELNSHPHRLDIDWRKLRGACERGLVISINPDAHSTRGFEDFEYGVWMARKALVPKEQIFNTWPLEKIEKHLGI
jgi:DNA polymerase (family 10)